MDPELSERCAAAVHALPPGRLSMRDRMDLADAAEDAADFDALPDWVKEVIEEGEAARSAPRQKETRRTPMLTYAELCERVRDAGADPAQVFDRVPEERLAQLQRGEVIRDGLCRTAVFEQVRAAGENGDGLTIEGYGLVFGSETQIRSWEGEFIEVIEAGATKKSLRELSVPGGGTKLKMQFDHGHHPLLGGLPLGRWNVAEEDEHGLHLVGRAYDDWLRAPFVTSIKDGGVDGMSFRFSVVKEKWEDKDGKELKGDELFELLFWGAGDRGPLKRTLREVKISEAGPVVWPAYKDTTVSARSAGGAMVIDLGALRSNPREAAFAVAQLDAAMAAAMAPPMIGGGARPGTPEQRWQPVGAAGLAEMVGTLVPSRRESAEEVVHTAAVRTADSASSPRTAEPQLTDAPADAHSTPEGEPRDTDDASAEQHSAPPAPTAPLRSRRNDLKARYRRVLTASLELPKS